MTEQIAVFRSRAQAVDCNARLRAAGIASNIINTPREANIGCGFSVKIPKNMFGKAQRIIAGGKYSAFYGYLNVKMY